MSRPDENEQIRNDQFVLERFMALRQSLSGSFGLVGLSPIYGPFFRGIKKGGRRLPLGCMLRWPLSIRVDHPAMFPSHSLAMQFSGRIACRLGRNFAVTNGDCRGHSMTTAVCGGPASRVRPFFDSGAVQ
jgi:hypothetical protein